MTAFRNTELVEPASNESRAKARRATRYKHLEWLRERSTRTAAAHCMHALGVEMTVGSTADGTTHVGGVSRCGSPWACSVCSPTIGERRASEIDTAIGNWHDQGGSVYFVTATLRHQYGDDAAQLLDMLQGAWSRTFRWGGGIRPPWYAGMVRAVEITDGKNGFHPHVHAAIFVEPGWADCLDDIARELHDLRLDWQESVERYGGSTAVSDASGCPGWDVRPVSVDGSTLGNYLAKIEGGWGAGLELARTDLKRARGRSGVTPFELLAAAVEGDTHAAIRFRIYERATAGRRRIVSSPGLMARCDVEELTDDEAAEADLDEPMVAVVSVPGDQWRRLLRAGFAVRLLDDVAGLARGELWPWPPDWIVRSP